MPVYVSQNNVALTQGRDGSLPNKYIYRVCILVRGQAVEVEARAGELPDPQSVDAVWQHLGSRQSAPRRARSAAARKRWRPALPTQFAVSAHAGLVSILTCPLSPQPALISQVSIQKPIQGRLLRWAPPPLLTQQCPPHPGNGRYCTESTIVVPPDDSNTGGVLGCNFTA